jgi:hypothetical protein
MSTSEKSGSILSFVSAQLDEETRNSVRRLNINIPLLCDEYEDCLRDSGKHSEAMNKLYNRCGAAPGNKKVYQAVICAYRKSHRK